MVSLWGRMAEVTICAASYRVPHCFLRWILLCSCRGRSSANPTETLSVGGMGAGCVGFRKFCVIAQQVKASGQSSGPAVRRVPDLRSVHLLKKVGSTGGGCCVPAYRSFSSLHSPVPHLCSRRYLWLQDHAAPTAG